MENLYLNHSRHTISDIASVTEFQPSRKQLIQIRIKSVTINSTLLK